METIMNNYNIITSPARIEYLNLGKLRHQEGPSPPSMKFFFLVIAMLEETLDTNKFIINPMQEINI